MKKLLVMLSAGCVLMLASCKSSDKKSGGGETDAAKKNMEAATTIMNAFQTGDISMIDSVVASDFVDHTDHGDVAGRDSLKAIIQMMQGMQMKMSVVKVLGNESHVFQWLRFTGTSDGKMGMPAGPYDFTEIELVRFQDGKAVEHWALVEPRVMMKMMPMPGMPADTSKLDPAAPAVAASGDNNSEGAKKNIAAMQSTSNMFATHDFSKIGDYIADDAVDWGGEKALVKGLANIKADLETAAKNMTDMKTEVIQEVADGEIVMSWMKFTGTMAQDGWGKKKGDKYASSGLEVGRYNKDNKCVEHWTFVEMREMMKEMANMGEQDPTKMPPPPPKNDTVK